MKDCNLSIKSKIIEGDWEIVEEINDTDLLLSIYSQIYAIEMGGQT